MESARKVLDFFNELMGTLHSGWWLVSGRYSNLLTRWSQSALDKMMKFINLWRKCCMLWSCWTNYQNREGKRHKGNKI